MHTHSGEPLHVLDGAQVLCIHDVGAMFVFEGWHFFAWAVAFLKQERLLGRRADAQGRLDLLDDFTGGVLCGWGGLVFPAAGIGAGALVGVSTVQVARQQAATGVGHAQGTVDEHFQLHVGHVLADFLDLFERQLARENHPAKAELLPELDTGPIHRVGLHREVDRHLREVLANQHDQARVGHDQGVGRHLDDRGEVLDEGLELGIVRRNVDHHVEALAQGMRLADTQRQVGVVELVVAHAQAVARLASIDRIGTVGEGVAQGLEGAGGASSSGLAGGVMCAPGQRRGC